MAPTTQEIEAARAVLAAADAEATAASEPVEAVGQEPAASAPAPGDAVGQAPSTSAPSPGDVGEAVQDVEQEATAVEAAVNAPSVETVAAAAEPVVTSALEALAVSKATNPHLSFVDHLKALADKGIAAALNPEDEAVVLGALVQIIKEVVA